MGQICGGVKEPRVPYNQIDEYLDRENVKDKEFRKILLLGPGESGKSTFFKQMLFGHGSGYDENQRLVCVPMVRHTVVTGAFEVLYFAKRMFPNFPVSPELKRVEEELDLKAMDDMGWKEFETERMDGIIDRLLESQSPEILAAIWNDPLIQKVWTERRHTLQVPESLSYFLGKRLNDIFNENYTPTDDDLLRVRIRTTGINQQEFSIEHKELDISCRCVLIDVGGQRSERKKWIKCFEGISGLIFLAAVSEFDQVCWEDESTNRIEEAMSLFKEVVNHPAFVNKSSMILFFNKIDLFKSKIERVPINTYFHDYKGPNTYEDSIEYITQQFLALKTDPTQEVYTFTTCAMDRDACLKVFNAVIGFILTKALTVTGLMENELL